MKKHTKFLSFILAILLIVTVVPMTVLAKADVPGDINGDSNVTSADARLALRFAVGLEAFTAKQTKIADVDGKPGITSADARLILRAAVGLEDLSITENTTAPVETTTLAPAPTYQPPSTKQEIVNFYAKAANDLKNNGAAGYTKKEWQRVDYINISNSIANNAVSSVLGSFITTEADAEEQVNARGSDDAKRRAFGWTLKDLSKVASAKCDVLPYGNYKITIVMVDEDTPKKKGSMLGQVTGAIFYWEDIEETLTTDPTVTPILKEFDDIHVIYKGFTIIAEMTPDGKFVTLDHLADIDIEIGHIKLLGISIDNKYAHMNNYCKFYNFQYPGYTSPTPEPTTRAPIENTTWAPPVENTTCAPVIEITTCAPATTTHVAIENTTAAPVEYTTWAPVECTTCAPAHP